MQEAAIQTFALSARRLLRQLGLKGSTEEYTYLRENISYKCQALGVHSALMEERLYPA